jgi:hypothetical protein
MTKLTTILSKPEDLESGEFVPAVNLPFNKKAVDNTWERHGIKTAPLLVKADNGKVYDDHKLKGIFKLNEQTKKYEYRKIVSRNYVVLPNEEVDNIVNAVIVKHGGQYGLKLNRTYEAYHGDAKYWEIFSDQILDIPKSMLKVNDVIKVGIVVRNSVGCNVTFGVDLMSWRLACLNGAIRKGRDMASLRVAHYGKNAMDLMYNELGRRIDDLFTEAENLVQTYRRAAKLKVRAEAAELLAKRISHKYIPQELIETDDEEHTVKVVKKGLDFWTLFNGLTENIWHSEQLSYLTKADMTDKIHRIIENEIVVSKV